MKHIFRLKRYGLFDARVPRFTTFPPATWFSDRIGVEDAKHWRGALEPGAEISLYVHIPFCKRLCWFCACRTQGTKTAKPLEGYVSRLLIEARMVRDEMPARTRVKRLHLGGGTPTILPAELLDTLLSGLNKIFGLASLAEFSAEIDPTDVGPDRLNVLAAFGLSRASLGIQDFAPQVQKSIGREQSFDRTRDVVAMLRERRVEKLNFDLLYGLPHQTLASLDDTLRKALLMDPDRIALFGYAHVPWMSKRQVMIPAEALPNPETRYQLFSTAAERFEKAGYGQIGIDHFAKPDDGLMQAHAAGTLRRSLQGYTDDDLPVLVGLGASAISTYPQGFVQNQPSTGAYSKSLDDGESPATRGYKLTEQDKHVAKFVEHLMCYHFAEVPSGVEILKTRLQGIQARYQDAVSVEGSMLTVKKWAHPLVRIIASELSMGQPDPSSEQRYSLAI